YIEVQTAQSSYGVSAAQSLISLTSMLWYAVPAFMVILLIKKHLARLPQPEQPTPQGAKQ
ncbi:ABC transporter permease, partial [Vibrio sp. 10N.222.55.E8]